ncbi:TDT family transporter [Natrialba asiatica]|uniref:Uncharacterized protein n=1 Tax=Natrialba asiatica (strain ATCC 700177 / DSM 12278 / JCM 9576 / FERM P-10747 / NBRC 102637 / 172P1) TaxID=29540 RepID=M0ANL0_NATA1|nr:hypothetical protein [Natrialba asiatica]ELY99502.1 hypothetical protein C481_14753 [Natrialba asiatica DSM 12278]
MSDERPPDDHDDRAGGPTDPSDDSPADVPDTSSDADAPGDTESARESGESIRDARDEQADGGYAEESATEQRESEPEPETAESASGDRSDRIAFWISALIGLALAVGAVALVSGRGPFFESVLRVRPTVDGGGVGADWVLGNTEPVLDALIAIVHFADVVLGIFILLMLFIHWAAFRRLATQMRPPSGTRTQEPEPATAPDGGSGRDDRSGPSRDDGAAASGGDRA